MKLALAGSGAALAGPTFGREREGSALPVDFDHLTIRHRTVKVDGLDIVFAVKAAVRPRAEQ